MRHHKRETHTQHFREMDIDRFCINRGMQRRRRSSQNEFVAENCVKLNIASLTSHLFCNYMNLIIIDSTFSKFRYEKQTYIEIIQCAKTDTLTVTDITIIMMTSR